MRTMPSFYILKRVIIERMEEGLVHREIRSLPCYALAGME